MGKQYEEKKELVIIKGPDHPNDEKMYNTLSEHASKVLQARRAMGDWGWKKWQDLDPLEVHFGGYVGIIVEHRQKVIDLGGLDMWNFVVDMLDDICDRN